MEVVACDGNTYNVVVACVGCMVKQEVVGAIGTLDVEITIHGSDETLANLIYADLVGRCDELNQIAELGKHPEATNPPLTADWEAYINGELPKDD